MRKLAYLLLAIVISGCASYPPPYYENVYSQPAFAPPPVYSSYSAPPQTSYSGRSYRSSTYRAPRNARNPATYRRYYLGPRGGCYYINSNGNKTYVDRSLCR